MKRRSISLPLSAAIILGAALSVLVRDHAETQRLKALQVALAREAALVRRSEALAVRTETVANDWSAARRMGRIPESAPRNGLPGLDSLNLSAARVRKVRAYLELRYRPLLERLGFSPEAIARWESGYVQYVQRLQDIADAAADQSLPPDDPGLGILRKQESADWTAQQEAMLGAEATQTLQTYSRALPVDWAVVKLAGSVAFSDSPLTSTQGSKVLQLLAHSSTAYQAGGSATLDSIDWTSALAQAKPLLSPAQFVQFQSVALNLQTRSALKKLVAQLTHP